MRRITKPLVLLLALVMVIGQLPMMAFAAESGTASVTVSATGGWDDYSVTAEVSLPFGSSGNKVKVWTDGVGINISAIAVNGDTRSLTDAAVEAQGGADFNGSAVENLHNDGSYAVIDLDALGFGDLSGTQNVAFTYATEHDGFALHAVSCYADEQPEETSAPTVEPNEVPADAEQEVAEFAGETGYQKVTVTGIAATGDWDATNSAYQNWFEVADVQLDPNGTVKVSGNRIGINVAAVEINGQKVTVTQMKNSGTVTVSGKDSQGADVNLEQKGSEYQIAYLDIDGVSATIGVSPMVKRRLHTTASPTATPAGRMIPPPARAARLLSGSPSGITTRRTRRRRSGSSIPMRNKSPSTQSSLTHTGIFWKKANTRTT